jgi:hypothetical protein
MASVGDRRPDTPYPRERTTKMQPALLASVSLAPAPVVLVQEHAAQLDETVRRILERGEDHRPSSQRVFRAPGRSELDDGSGVKDPLTAKVERVHKDRVRRPGGDLRAAPRDREPPHIARLEDQRLVVGSKCDRTVSDGCATIAASVPAAKVPSPRGFSAEDADFNQSDGLPSRVGNPQSDLLSLLGPNPWDV